MHKYNAPPCQFLLLPVQLYCMHAYTSSLARSISQLNLLPLLFHLLTGLACAPERLPTFSDLTSITAQDVKLPQINRQWIFPSLRFTCSLNVTGWVFRTASNQVEPNTKCPTLGLWRDNDITPSNTADYV